MNGFRTAGWPLNAAGAPEADRLGVPEAGRRPQDTSDTIVHMTLWYHQPTTAPQLHLSYGMDFHGEQAHPSGWQGAFRMDPNGQGYTLEYALPWSLLQAGNRPPRDGDVLAANWTVHWSDGDGRQSRGHLVEITNVENRPYRFLRVDVGPGDLPRPRTASSRNRRTPRLIVQAPGSETERPHRKLTPLSIALLRITCEVRT